jgi:hypothetical protein
MAAYLVLRAAIRSVVERKQMQDKTYTYTPVNRHLLIKLLDLPSLKKQTEHGILLPDDFKPQQSEYATVEILKCAADAKLDCTRRRTKAIVERHMIKSVECADGTIHMIQKNYTLCR